MTSRSGDAKNLISELSEPLGPEALDTLYRRYKDKLRRRIAHKFGLGPPDPDDAVQAAFERYARLENPGAVQDPEAFLLRVAGNFVIDHIRGLRVRNGHSDDEFFTGDRTDDWDAERVLSAKERLAIIDRTIRSMDKRRQEVLIMNRIHGVSCADIARRLHRSPTLVKILIAEAITLCERALREAEGE